MRCAVVNAQGVVINIIMADPEVDIAPEGCTLYEIPQNVWINPDMNWEDRVVIVPDDPPLQEEVIE